MFFETVPVCHVMYLGAAIPLVGAVIEPQQRGAARALVGLTLATCVYTLVTVPLITPRDSGHVIPRAFAAVLIVIGFTKPERRHDPSNGEHS